MVASLRCTRPFRSTKHRAPQESTRKHQPGELATSCNALLRAYSRAALPVTLALRPPTLLLRPFTRSAQHCAVVVSHTQEQEGPMKIHLRYAFSLKHVRIINLLMIGCAAISVSDSHNPRSLDASCQMNLQGARGLLTLALCPYPHHAVVADPGWQLKDPSRANGGQ